MCCMAAPASCSFWKAVLALPDAILRNTAVRIQWTGALQLDPARAHNQLCLINDFRGVPGAPDLGNVAWVEMEDR